jgi:hypothetical protein
MKSYHEDGSSGLDGLLKVAFMPFENQIRRDNEKYIKICERNKTNGLLGGRPKPRGTQKNPVGYSGLKNNPKEPDTDTDTDTDTKKKKEETLPLFLNLEVWGDFLKMRKEIKKPVTVTAIKSIFRDLAKYEEEGYSANLILRRSISNNWQGIFPDDSCKKINKIKIIDPSREAML